MRGVSLGMATIPAGMEERVLRERLAQIREWGYDAVEPLTDLVDDAVSARLDKASRAAGLAVSGFRTGDIYRRHGISFSDPDPAVRDAAVAAIVGVLRIAGRFPGAKVFNGMIQGKPKAGADLGEAKRRVAECFRRCLDEAERLGVEMCLEPLNQYDLSYNNTVSEVAAFIRGIGSKRLTILVDTFHMNIEEHDIAGALREHADMIGGVHFMDSTRREPGTGHLDLPGLYRALVEGGYRGYLTVEMDGHPRYDEAAPVAARYLRRLVDGA